MPGTHTSSGERHAMTKRYQSGESVIDIAKSFGRDRNTVYDELQRGGVVCHGRLSWSRRYHVDETFFDVIDTEMKAYWLGFISADGTIAKSRLEVGLAIVDSSHITKMLDDMKSNHPVRRIQCCVDGVVHESARIQIGSVKLVRSLARHGVMPNKSLSLRPCENIPESFHHHYWRGLVDGDGGIGYTYSRGNGSIQWCVYLAGSEHIVNGFTKWVRRFIDRNPSPQSAGKAWQIKYNGNRTTKVIVQELHRDATRWLDRKKHLADVVMKVELQRGMIHAG